MKKTSNTSLRAIQGKKPYQTPVMEVHWLENTDIVTSSIYMMAAPKSYELQLDSFWDEPAEAAPAEETPAQNPDG